MSKEEITRTLSPYEAGTSTNIPSQVNAALSVTESMLKSPATVRKVSVSSGETNKTGMFSRKKSCEPSLLITFTRDENQDQDKIDYGQNPSVGSPPGIKSPNLMVEENGISKSVMVHVQDKIASASVASFRSAQLSSQEIDENKIE